MDNEMDRNQRWNYEHPIKLLSYLLTPFIYICSGAVAFMSIIHAMVFQPIAHLNRSIALYRYHIFLCTVGYIILGTQAILIWSPFNSWSREMSIKSKAVVHAIMQISGSILAAAGCIIKLTDTDTERFSSTHGILGVAAFIATLITLLTGLSKLLACNAMTSKIIRRVHSIVGLLSVTLAYTCLCFGFDHMDFRNSVSLNTAVINFSIILAAVAENCIFVVVVYDIFKDLFSNPKTD